ncbi:four helix bundle protein [Flavobacterium sp. Fl-318]|uniref:Four helix bundle protein n=1 Tax=Flavobacterium cupriresistens TaxID=2893885 RepID=A0ABU4R7D7_9FLAO|nr:MULTISPECIES: four helix bundle protein [unclassified Flavobacterium]MDX6188468.1 four helix bundle protein [Flavobacterium sp. Fl-318]UFH44861.1 four helix bundle protein [Flavobacterium sp. F-323]
MDIYKLTSKFPSNELFGITSQIRRSTSSIVTNIAEGTSREIQIKRKLVF